MAIFFGVIIFGIINSLVYLLAPATKEEEQKFKNKSNWTSLGGC